jgi:hypothetical protein
MIDSPMELTEAECIKLVRESRGRENVLSMTFGSRSLLLPGSDNDWARDLIFQWRAEEGN